ncbi:ataxin-10 [Episyrphus balteatus]|uniref:ataxin-10 n=1 Tax=Episyrphus balteatus TaxID=286459 RepID=UPI00248661A1|nr:ataxin-10 [Episyrphus balteatus]
MSEILDLEKVKTNLENINENLKKLIAGEVLDNCTLEDTKLQIRSIRNACSQGTQAQNFLIEQEETIAYMQMIVSKDLQAKDLIELSWQFVANLTVQNEKSQKFVWDHLGETLTDDIRIHPIDNNTDKKLMIIYNICRGGLVECSEKFALTLLADIWHRIVEEQSNEELVFVDLFFEYFLVTNQWTLRLYATISAQNRIDILKYITTYIRNDSPNGPIRTILMEYISKEFKKKADCILRNSGDMENSLHPQEVYNLLSVISCATGSELYYNIYARDDALFLSAGALLQSIVALGKKEPNQFTPMTKLEEVAPGSNIDTSFELEISFELKTLLVRTIGNLLCTNRHNQQHCIDTKLLPALLECTNMDARNPLIKEWSILAIRNACYDCPEIQHMISELTEAGQAPNQLLTELNIEMGALRIQPKE